MATDFKKVLIPLAAAHPNRLLPNLPILKLPSSSISKTPLQSPSLPSLYNVGGAQRSDTKMPQNGLIEISSDNKSDESNKLSLGSWHKFKSESGASTGDARLPGGRAEQGVGSPFVASQGQGSGASVAAAALHAILDRLNARLDHDKFVEGSSEAMSNNDRMLADVGLSLQPSIQPSAS
ncbi:hypothetical protein MYCTH_2130132 [Thermothelomyces thermophilus ATCC 42464]|uniref:Uncharacterized protein n=1 Tax=Thermothelomyces thermophilus (strain ATCC 42464 / BCRC 31852 / DSM 1799) TaxID=573729 RepID=G2QM03_THET4|nr:uncharacterized protein MYCTH_2130132 [Thermothelomyces thermophilus ATCC 42464]AEO60983.1 hypothetical protein MYCTH_2130132 [Thermothelomyces thermophilus ATCC 42464]